jgi:hypothetical protein
MLVLARPGEPVSSRCEAGLETPLLAGRCMGFEILELVLVVLDLV